MISDPAYCQWCQCLSRNIEYSVETRPYGYRCVRCRYSPGYSHGKTPPMPPLNMVMKVSRTSFEVCVVLGCFLIIFITVMQILILNGKSLRLAKTNTAVADLATSHKPTESTHPDRDKNAARKNRLALAQAKAKLRNKIRLEIMAIEKAIANLLKNKPISPQESAEIIKNDLYARRVKGIIETFDSRNRELIKSNQSRLLLPHGEITAGSINRSDNSQRSNSSQQLLSAPKFGIPLTFEPALTTQEIANSGALNKRQLISLKHFRDFNQNEEDRLKKVLFDAQNYGEENISTSYEDNFMKVKKQFQEGTELSVDEDLLRKQYGKDQDLCPLEPESLVGNTTDIQLNITLDIEEVEYNNSDVMEGGEWQPADCISRHRVAIVIPYRDRWNHLKVLLHYLIPTLKRQQIHFRIFVVEQYGNETFNKGRIMNAAFKEALKLFDFHCVTFHDVDLVPEDDRNMYTCTEQPKHMSHSIDKFKYTLPYQGLVGGVLMFKTEHFLRVNGYSNMYWGWGAEDDDMTTRILFHGLRIYRPPSNIAKYKMVKHEGRKSSEIAVRMKLLRSAAKRSKLEGLNNVNYTLLSTTVEKLFTHFIVDIGQQ